MLGSMNRYLQGSMLLLAVCVLSACGIMRSSVVVEPAPGNTYRNAPSVVAPSPARTPIPGGSYQVMHGDTLYSIAFRKGVDFRDLAQWNNIAAPYTIWPGQQLILSPHAKQDSGHAATLPPAKSATTSVATAPMFEPVLPAPAAAPAESAGPAVAATASAAHSPVSGTTVARPVVPAVAATVPNVVPVAGVPAEAPAAMPPPAPPAAGVSRVVSGVQWHWPADGTLVGRFSSGDAIPGIEIAGKAGDPVRAAADGVVVYSGNGLVGYGELVIIKHNDSFLSAYGHNRKRLVKEGQRVSRGQQIAEMGSTGASRNELEFQIRKDGNPVDPLTYLPQR
ncbi:peptidoglycan DD-metalloendopeptidase family protein [Rhodanobacter sp. AS-Z3]|uniref:peptidoglycan DD-metalloendopeptidase family protein n=1 Tax=Rhodanobacter sp. AS-Z3 TaxID=3031330 RepID=UPI002479866D|nr:peptidoglycan DD-metalloendopeptidase family protein [Rhodanobacter sp. AS-Z3]WEN16857.1 peptidoglycan DD-metalloendopeptidase family protein [Rhodanobacter sp. AS-Z3]